MQWKVSILVNYSTNFWKDKRVVITGHTGFKGSWLTLVLLKLGAKIIGISNGEVSFPSIFSVLKLQNKIYDCRCDISDVKPLTQILEKEKPDVIFHLAAQALVKQSIADPYETFRVNAMGMASLMEAIIESGKIVPTILITSDKVYENKEWYWGYKETDELGGKDPYSASKACAELIAQSYLRTVIQQDSKYFGIARAGNVIGGGDWAADRLIPDCYRSWSKDKEVHIRMPNATRPWQHVLEPISGYIALAERLTNNPFDSFESFNFGPDFQASSTVGEVVSYLGQNRPVKIEEKPSNEANLLALNCDKAKFLLGWFPKLNQGKTLEWTRTWYDCYYAKGDVTELTNEQIEKYLAARGLICIN